MNMSDLQMILGLSYSMNHSTLSENKDVDSNSHGSLSKVVCLSAAGERGGDVLFVSGARPRMSRRHSMENLELMNLTPDKINVSVYRLLLAVCLPDRWFVSSSSLCSLKGQKRSSDILTKQSKPSLAKSSSKLFFVSRLRGKKYKTSGSSKVLQDTSNTQDTNQGPTQGPQKVPQINTLFPIERPVKHQRAVFVLCASASVLT